MLERTRGGRVDGRTFKEVDIFAVGSESVVPSRAGTNFMRAERERERERGRAARARNHNAAAVFPV